jgi:phosphoglucosamine mutase
MVAGGHPVGGEQSGHIILLDDARTGDGILAAIRLIEGLEKDPIDLEAEAAAVPRYPQVLKNLKVREKRPLPSLPGVPEAIAAAEARLGADGRVNVRYSGTEPLARVMIEGPDGEVIDRLADAIIQAIAAAEGAG